MQCPSAAVLCELWLLLLPAICPHSTTDVPLPSMLPLGTSCRSQQANATCCLLSLPQATSFAGLIFLAGQIPLDPSSMAIKSRGLAAQARLAVANTQAVAIAAGGCAAAASLGLTVYLAEAARGEDGSIGARRVVWQLLQQLQEDAVGFMARAARESLQGRAAVIAAGGGQEGFSKQPAGEEEPGEQKEVKEAVEGDEEEEYLDDYLRAPATAVKLRPPVVLVEVPALPRG